MKIILLAADFPPSMGGIQHYSASLADSAYSTGVDVRVIAIRQPGSEQFDAAASYEILRVPGGSKWAVWQQMRQAAQMMAEGEGQTVIVATKWFPEGPAAVQAAHKAGAISALIGYDREFALHGLNIVKWAMQKYVLGHSEIIFATTAFAAQQFQSMGVPRVKIYHLSGGVDSDKFYPDPEGAARIREDLGLSDAPVIVTISRLAAHKGHRYVLQALPLVQMQVPDVRYVIVGDGPYRQQLEKYAHRYDVTGRVVFTGRVSAQQLRAYYTMADVMAMPSFDVARKPTEGFGLTYLEANACGTPVIGAMTGGVPEAVEHEVSGLLVPPRDFRAVAKALIRLLGDPDYAKALGESGRTRALNNFSWSLVTRRFIAALTGPGTSPSGRGE